MTAKKEFGQPVNCPFECCPLTSMQADRRWEVEVGAALAEGRIKLYRQRIVTRAGVQRFEVLTRLVKDGEVLSPAVWMPALEGNAGLARTFDLWVLEAVVARLAALPEGEQVWVNVFGWTMRWGFAAQVGALLEKYGVRADRLCIELTESVAAGEGYKEEISRLRLLGCDVAIDDVGAGLSNLGSLVELQISWLKIDGALLGSPRRLLAAKHLTLLGKELRLGVVAEWVETYAQAMLLWGWGVDGMQGFDVPRRGAGVPKLWD